jgi:hypothetical protein
MKNFVMVCALFWGIFATPVLFAASDAPASKEQWQRVGVADKGFHALYIDVSTKSHIPNGSVTARARKELSHEAFGAMVAKAEKESGSKVEYPEELYAILRKSSIQYFKVVADCGKNKFTMLEEKTDSRIHVVVEDTAKPGSAEYDMIRLLCEGKAGKE